MRASVPDVGSWYVVWSFPPLVHCTTRGFSCARVEAISDEKKSGIAMKDAIASGERLRPRSLNKRAMSLTRSSPLRALVRGTNACALPWGS
jgi:hypothetical protein